MARKKQHDYYPVEMILDAANKIYLVFKEAGENAEKEMSEVPKLGRLSNKTGRILCACEEVKEK